MKTGTTSLQLAAHYQRDKLLANGVRYPGSAPNHRRGLGALMGWSVNTWARSGPLGPDLLDVDTSGIPSPKDWQDLQTEIDHDTDRRIFLSHEFVSQVDDDTARHILETIGPRTHVCLTLRSPGKIMPSLWSQGIKDDAQTEPFDSWLTRFYGKDADRQPLERLQRAYNQSQLVARWSELVGPENVTVIVIDKSDPTLLTRSFEEMLGLPRETLNWKRSNDSLTATDAELFRQVNIKLRDRKASWSTFHNLVWQGAIKRGPEWRVVDPDEPRVVLPPWAAEIAAQDGRRFAEELADSPVRIVGDLSTLAVPGEAHQSPPIEQIPTQVAADAVAGAVLAGQDARAQLRKQLSAKAAEIKRLNTELAGRADEDKRQRTDGQQLADEVSQLLAERDRLVAGNKHLSARNEQLSARPANSRAEQSLRARIRLLAPEQRAAELANAFRAREIATALKIQVIRKLRSLHADRKDTHRDSTADRKP